MLHRKSVLLTCMLTALLGGGATLVAQNDETVRRLFAGKLTHVPGQTLTAERGAAYRGVVLSGTNGPPNWKERFARALSRVQLKRLGGRHPGTWLDDLVIQKTYNRQFAPNRTTCDWLSRDAQEVDKYIDDPLCNFPLTAQAWFDFLHGKAMLGDEAHLQKIPKALPVWMMSGAEDPVGENTSGVKRLLQAYKDAGLTKVSHRFYADARHELLNETSATRREATDDLIRWLNNVIHG